MNTNYSNLAKKAIAEAMRLYPRPVMAIMTISKGGFKPKQTKNKPQRNKFLRIC